MVLSWHVDRTGSGYAVRFVWSPNSPHVTTSVPTLATSALEDLQAFVAANGIPVEVNPEPPWRDRTGLWHGDLLDHDPTESIRSIRKAAIGPWVVQVYPRGGEFIAITKWTKDGTAVREGQLRATLAEAVADGVAQVGLAQTEVGLLP